MDTEIQELRRQVEVSTRHSERMERPNRRDDLFNELGEDEKFGNPFHDVSGKTTTIHGMICSS